MHSPLLLFPRRTTSTVLSQGPSIRRDALRPMCRRRCLTATLAATLVPVLAACEGSLQRVEPSGPSAKTMPGRLQHVVLVDLEEGPRMLSRWAGGPEHRPQMGQRVRVRFVQVQQEQWLPFFEPDEGQRT